MGQEVRLQQLVDAFERDLPALTIELGRLYLADAPDEVIALTMIGQAYVSVARYAEAKAAYERALSLCPPDRTARICTLLGNLHEASSDLPTAESFYLRAIERAPEDASAYLFLGSMLAKAARLEEAESILQRATACPTGCVDEVYLNLGFVLRAKGEYLQALEMFRESLRLDPTDEDAQNALQDMDSVLFQFPDA